jgi:hypothetical protein
VRSTVRAEILIVDTENSVFNLGETSAGPEQTLAELVVGAPVDVDVQAAREHVAEAALDQARIAQSLASGAAIREECHLLADLGHVGGGRRHLLHLRRPERLPAIHFSDDAPEHIVHQEPDRAQRQRLLRKLALEDLLVAQRRASHASAPALDDLLDLVERALRDAQPPARVAQPRERDRANPEQGAALLRLALEDRKGPAGLDELIPDLVVEAARAAQPHHVPAVEQLDAFARHEVAHVGRQAAGQRLRLVVGVQQEAAATGMRRVADAATELVTTRHAIVSVLAPQLTAGRELPRDRPAGLADDLLGGIRRQKGHVRGGTRVGHHAPADRSISLGEFLENVDDRVGIGLEPTQRTGHHQME